MSLSTDLISQFVKVTNDNTKDTKETTIVYGTTVVSKGKTYVKLDGSELLTPISATADTIAGERVTVMIKNHTATITGNISSPAARVEDVNNIKLDSSKITELEILVADKVDTSELNAESARIDVLVSDNILIKDKLFAAEAAIDELEASDITITGTLNANTAEIASLKTTKLDVTIANATYATIDSLEAIEGDFHTLESTYGIFASLTTDRLDAIDATLVDLNVENLSAKYANIDFSNIGTAAIEKIFAESGLIENIIVGDGTITGRLVGVTISGDLIEGNTVVAEKLVIKGSDGLYYKLNTDGMTTEAQQTDQNSLNGSVIKAKSITASKINVKDLVAFNATIGGFNLTETSIYSGAKSTVSNTTRGIYLDKDGQLGVGDSNNFIKYYKDTDGNYKLALSAESIIFATSKKSIESTISDAVTNASETLSVSGRNLIVRRGELLDTYVINDGSVADADTGYKSATMLYSIKVDPGQNYTFSKSDTAASLYFRWVWYDSNMNYLGRETSDVTPYTWTAPDNASYIRVSYPYVDGANPKLEKGSESTAYTPALEDLADTMYSIENGLSEYIVQVNDELHAELNDLEIGGSNLIKNSDFKYGTNDWVSVGVTVSVEGDETFDTYIKMESTEVGSSTSRIYASTTDNFNHKPGTYALSFYAKADSNTTIQSNIAGGTAGSKNYALTTEWKRFTHVYTASSTGSLTLWPNEANSTVYLTHIKLENGDKPTDWTPATEDMATASEAENAKTIAEEAKATADEATALIAQLSDSIAMLVTDGNGSSLMTQTEDGWTFSTANIQEIINTTSEGLDNLTNDLGNVSSVVDILQKAVDDLGVISEYVKIGTYENEPCIELGESDSDFKLIITNTRIMFMEASDVPAYINNQSLNIKKAVVEEEFRQGDFVWKVRSNGNLGLTWRGET